MLLCGKFWFICVAVLKLRNNLHCDTLCVGCGMTLDGVVMLCICGFLVDEMWLKNLVKLGSSFLVSEGILLCCIVSRTIVTKTCATIHTKFLPENCQNKKIKKKETKRGKPSRETLG